MSLRKLYLLWSIAVTISAGIGILFFLIAMSVSYGNFSGHEEFDGLVYAIESLLIFIFSTGLVSGLLVLLSERRSNKILGKRLAIRLFSFHTLSALFGIITFRYAFIYLNPLGLIIFIMLPQLALKASGDKKQTKKWTTVFTCLLIAILIVGALEFLSIVLSDPYRR